jgi:hypothetical protein
VAYFSTVATGLLFNRRQTTSPRASGCSIRTERSVRIEHGLRWWLKNFRDEDKATADLDLPNHTPLESKCERIIAIGEAARRSVHSISKG